MNVGKQGRTSLSRESLGAPQREISALMLSLRKAIKSRGNNACRVHKAAAGRPTTDRDNWILVIARPRKIRTVELTDRTSLYPRFAVFALRSLGFARRRNRRFNEKCTISRALRRTKGNCERVDAEVIIEDENSDELRERAPPCFNERAPFPSHCELGTKSEYFPIVL